MEDRYFVKVVNIGQVSIKIDVCFFMNLNKQNILTTKYENVIIIIVNILL